MKIPLIVLISALAMMSVEASHPGRSWPRVLGWWRRVFIFNFAQLFMVGLLGVTLDRWIARQRLWSADALGISGGAIVGYLVVTFVSYWWHRWRHQSSFLWRWLHQLHHSPQRVEIATSFYKHPFELVINSALLSALLYLVLGLGTRAATQTVLIAGVTELFYHWNVNTPYWLGFIVQRPESHCVHHQEGHHHYNYSDLPIWDMLFGTFRNPQRWQARCGFGEKEHWLGAMLRGTDVATTRITSTHV